MISLTEFTAVWIIYTSMITGSISMSVIYLVARIKHGKFRHKLAMAAIALAVMAFIISQYMNFVEVKW